MGNKLIFPKILNNVPTTVLNSATTTVLNNVPLIKSLLQSVIANCELRIANWFSPHDGLEQCPTKRNCELRIANCELVRFTNLYLQDLGQIDVPFLLCLDKPVRIGFVTRLRGISRLRKCAYLAIDLIVLSDF